MDNRWKTSSSEQEIVERVGVSEGAGVGVGNILGVLSLKQEQKKWFRRFTFSLGSLAIWDKYERFSWYPMMLR